MAMAHLFTVIRAKGVAYNMNYTTQEKFDWVLEYIATHDQQVNTLDVNFLDGYFFRFPTKSLNEAPIMARLLFKMKKKGLLKRKTLGIFEPPAGIPNWCWVYSVPTPKNS